tara:strand:+ start:324 stop:530 length:207 start_codon:yes stop_codon:yes gene_type:complete
MSIGGALTGLFILLQTIVDGDIKKTTYQGTIYVGKIIQKSDERSWKSSLTEESKQYIKNNIYRIGGIK